MSGEKERTRALEESLEALQDFSHLATPGHARHVRFINRLKLLAEFAQSEREASRK